MMTFNCIYKNTETFKKDFTNNNNTLLKLLKILFSQLWNHLLRSISLTINYGYCKF